MTGPVIKTRGIFYGWFALAGVMLIVFTMGGSFVNSFGVFLPVMSGDLGWGRGTVALAMSIGIVAFGLPSPLFGMLVVRFGARNTMIWGNALAGLALAGIYFIQEPWHFYLLYIMIGLGAGFGGYIACTTVITAWFRKRRSLALGLFAACGGLSGFVFPPVVTTLIEAIGWRLTWVATGGAVMTLGVLLGGVLLVRDRPEDKGTKVDGIPLGFADEPMPESVPVARNGPGGGRITVIMKERTVWTIAIFVAANAFVIGTMNAHQVAYLEDVGYLPLVAASVVSVASAMSVIGSIMLGALALRLNVKYLGTAGFISLAGAVTVLLTTHELGLIYVYAMLLGLGNGTLLATMPTILALHYHGARYSQSLGIVLPFQVCVQAIGALTAGFIYDAAQSYQPAFLAAATAVVIGFIFISITRVPKGLAPARA
jgi:MFS family permease